MSIEEPSFEELASQLHNHPEVVRERNRQEKEQSSQEEQNQSSQSEEPTAQEKED